MSLNDGDMGHLSAHCNEEKRTLLIDRGGMQIAVNLGPEDARFELPEGFRIALSSRDGLNASEGSVTLPPDTLAVLSAEPE